jgi:hypothetical protein
MRILISGFIGSLLATSAGAQWYAGYPYPNPNVTVVYPPPPVVIVNSPPVVVASEPPQQVLYLIAFKDNVVRLATAYWVKGNTLYYVTSDHQQRTAPLDCVDRKLSERLNAEQQVAFSLPPASPKAEFADASVTALEPGAVNTQQRAWVGREHFRRSLRLQRIYSHRSCPGKMIKNSGNPAVIRKPVPPG